MSKRVRKISLVIILIVCLLFQSGIYEAMAAPNWNYFAQFGMNYKKEKETKPKKNSNKNNNTTAATTTKSETTTKETTGKTTTKVEVTSKEEETTKETTKATTEKVTTKVEETTTEEVTTTEKETTTEKVTTKAEVTSKEEETTKATTEKVTTKTEVTSKEEETTKATTEKVTTKAEVTSKEEETTKATTEKVTTKTEVTTKEETTKATTEKDTIKVEETTTSKPEINTNTIRYENVAAEEAEWLWAQQLSNGAFAVHNEISGTVDINPYFSEIVAIALINYDNSDDAKVKIEKYFDWHLSHINTATSDYNGLAGTIYDYSVKVKNGIVISETSKGVYDSTDSYSALFVKALGDYVKAYGDTSYLKENAAKIKDVVNVMFATMSPNGYTYAKPDYQIIYLMDNTEVFAGLTAAKYIYENAIEDSAMLEKVTKAVKFYEENFNKHWWKGDHYASVLNPDYSEYTGYAFSWDMFYPCATAQMFPIMYGIIEPDSQYAKTLYAGLCAAWDWQEMDYVTEGVDAFCWGSFAYLGGLVEDEERLNGYLDKYDEIVEAGRKYPLYSAESAMVLMGCMEMMK